MTPEQLQALIEAITKRVTDLEVEIKSMKASSQEHIDKLKECIRFDNALLDYEAKSKNYIITEGTYHGRKV